MSEPRIDKNLEVSLTNLGGQLREMAQELTVNARRLHGLQGHCFRTADKLDDLAAQVLHYVNINKGESNEQTPSHQG